MHRSYKSSKRVLLVGWDGADWKLINPLLDAGKLPHLERLVNEGVMGNLATLSPDLSPMLWTSISTGKRPFKHGILGFTEPDPHGRGIRPVMSLSRKTKAFWNILSQSGFKCNVVSWWPSHPAEPISGAMVSDLFKGHYRPLGEQWPIPPGAVHPERISKNLQALRWHPQLLQEGHILPFVPKAALIDQDKDRRLETVARIICDCATILNVSLALMIHEPWDVTAVYFDGIDHFSHAFMRFYPPVPDWVPKRDAEIYGQVVESAYIFHDIMLGRLLRHVGEETTVIVLSDHGFHSDHLRPKRIPREPAGPAAQHRAQGIFVMKGPGIKKDERIYGACLLDICPTLLLLLGLPVGEDMDGRPLLDAFEVPPTVTKITRWDAVSGDSGMHPPDQMTDPIESGEAIEQLAALGYIERPDKDTAKAVRQTLRELKYNEARAYMDGGLFGAAASLLKELLREWPDEYRFGIQLSYCLKVIGRVREARAALEDTIDKRLKIAAKAKKEIEELRKELAERADKNPKREEISRLNRLRMQASVDEYAIQFLRGSIALAEGDLRSAITHCKQAELADDRQPGHYLLLGEIYLKMKLWDEAERSFSNALRLDPDSAAGHLGRSRALAAMRQNREAMEAIFDSLSLDYNNPVSHFLLGTILHRSNKVPEAILALKVATKLNPNYVEAWRRLGYIYRKRLGDTSSAEDCLRIARDAANRLRSLRRDGLIVEKEAWNCEEACSLTFENEKESSEIQILDAHANSSKVVTIVSGLPRSGTSMMMQMLAAGGLEILSDGERMPDSDNPRGYFEYSLTKSIISDVSWLHRAEGKAIKIVAPLLKYLPSG